MAEACADGESAGRGYHAPGRALNWSQRCWALGKSTPLPRASTGLEPVAQLNDRISAAQQRTIRLLPWRQLGGGAVYGGGVCVTEFMDVANRNG